MGPGRTAEAGCDWQVGAAAREWVLVSGRHAGLTSGPGGEESVLASAAGGPSGEEGS